MFKEKNCQKIVSLLCGFRFNKERHIDECMCFMPYGTTWKVWFYYIRNIKYSDELKSKLESILKYKESTNSKLNIIINTRSNSPKTCTLAQLFINKIAGIDIDDTLFSDLYKTEFANIKRGIIPNEEKYLELFNPLSSLNKVKNLDILQKNLQNEQMENLNIVSMELYNKLYNECREHFVLFPIDLEIDGQLQFKILNIPIFNRLWYENDTDCYFIYSSTSDLDPEVYCILKEEIKLIKSILNPDKKINIHKIDTTKYNKKGGTSAVGGNLHCLIKNIY